MYTCRKYAYCYNRRVLCIISFDISDITYYDYVWNTLSWILLDFLIAQPVVSDSAYGMLVTMNYWHPKYTPIYDPSHKIMWAPLAAYREVPVAGWVGGWVMTDRLTTCFGANNVISFTPSFTYPHCGILTYCICIPQGFGSVKFVMTPPYFVQHQYFWNIVIEPEYAVTTFEWIHAVPTVNH